MKLSFLNFCLLIIFILAPTIVNADQIKVYIAKDIVSLNSNNDSFGAVATQGSIIINAGSREKLTATYPNAEVISIY